MLEIKTSDNSEQLKLSLNKTAGRLKDLTAPLKQTGVYMLASINKNFTQEGRPIKWKPLRPSTIARRKRGGIRILQDTGALKQSITSKVDTADQSVKIGTNIAYGKIHQFGLPSRKIPQRKFLLFQTEDVRRIEKIFDRYITQTLKK